MAQFTQEGGKRERSNVIEAGRDNKNLSLAKSFFFLLKIRKE